MSPDFDTLRFPNEIEEVIGLSRNEICYLKKKGCPFYGRKTTIRWVREFIAKAAGAQPVPLPPSHQQGSIESKCGEPSVSSGSRVASLALRTGRLGGSGK